VSAGCCLATRVVIGDEGVHVEDVSRKEEVVSGRGGVLNSVSSRPIGKRGGGK